MAPQPNNISEKTRTDRKAAVTPTVEAPRLRQAKASYSKTMEDAHRLMDSMEKIVFASINTREDIKQGIKELGKTFRELQKYSKMLGFTRDPDALEKWLEEQFHKQLETYEVVKEIRAAQQQCHCYDGLGTAKNQEVSNATRDLDIASGSNARMKRIEKPTGKSTLELREILESKDRTEKESFYRNGRGLIAMLEAAKEAKTVAKPAQAALAETINAYELAIGARRQRHQATDLPTEQEWNAPTPDLVVPVLEEISVINRKLADQGEIIRSLADRAALCSAEAASDDQTGDAGKWSEVMSKGTNIEDTERDATRRAKEAGPAAQQQEVRNRFIERPQSTDNTKSSKRFYKPEVRQRPPVILVEAGTAEFPELVKIIRGGANRNVIGDHITKMRRSKAGGLLIELKGNQKQIEGIRAEISRAARADIMVKSFQQRILVEIRDLDLWTDVDEVADAVVAATGASSEASKVLNLRTRHGGTQTALLLIPATASHSVLKNGRIHIGLVNCRIRQVDQRVK